MNGYRIGTRPACPECISQSATKFVKKNTMLAFRTIYKASATFAATDSTGRYE